MYIATACCVRTKRGITQKKNEKKKLAHKLISHSRAHRMYVQYEWMWCAVSFLSALIYVYVYDKDILLVHMLLLCCWAIAWQWLELQLHEKINGVENPWKGHVHHCCLYTRGWVVQNNFGWQHQDDFFQTTKRKKLHSFVWSLRSNILFTELSVLSPAPKNRVPTEGRTYRGWLDSRTAQLNNYRRPRLETEGFTHPTKTPH